MHSGASVQPRSGTGPAEFAEGVESRVEARRLPWRWPGIGPQEFPVDVRTSALLNEVLRQRQRLYALETQQFVAAFRGGVALGWGPQEYPEGGEGGGGGGGYVPVPHEIAEFPVPEVIANLASLVERLTRIESRLIEIETRLQVSEASQDA